MCEIVAARCTTTQSARFRLLLQLNGKSQKADCVLPSPSASPAGAMMLVWRIINVTFSNIYCMTDDVSILSQPERLPYAP